MTLTKLAKYTRCLQKCHQFVSP